MSKEKGKISAIARGVRKISSRRSGSLDSLNLVKLNLSEDKSGFYSINEVTVENSYSQLKNSLNLVIYGMYFAELVDVFLESGHENYEVYKLLKSAFNVLSKNPAKPEVVVYVFEVRLLENLGLGIHLEKTHPELSSAINLIKTERNLSKFMTDEFKVSKQVEFVIKNHLKNMVETYGRFPKLNKFLTDNV